VNASTQATQSRYSLVVDDATIFLLEKLPPREMLLSPFLEAKSLGMIHAWRGVGKTHVMLGMAVAQASGGKFLNWHAPKASRVIYVDGEMADINIQQWLRDTVEQEGMPALRQGMFNLIARDRQQCGIPTLMYSEGRDLIEEHLEDDEPTTIYLDNISSLFRGGNEKESMDWEDAQEWLVELRSHGHSVVLAHHDGKGGFQRGTSSREDPLDWVIQLRRPKNYQFEEGLRLEVHFEKARCLFGQGATPFEASLIAGPDGRSVWATKKMQDAIADAIVQMHDGLGMSFRDIAKRLETGGNPITHTWARKLYDKAVATAQPTGGEQLVL
jgi:hypothetical protein